MKTNKVILLTKTGDNAVCAVPEVDDEQIVFKPEIFNLQNDYLYGETSKFTVSKFYLRTWNTVANLSHKISLDNYSLANVSKKCMKSIRNLLSHYNNHYKIMPVDTSLVTLDSFNNRPNKKSQIIKHHGKSLYLMSINRSINYVKLIYTFYSPLDHDNLIHFALKKVSIKSLYEHRNDGVHIYAMPKKVAEKIYTFILLILGNQMSSITIKKASHKFDIPQLRNLLYPFYEVFNEVLPLDKVLTKYEKRIDTKNKIKNTNDKGEHKTMTHNVSPKPNQKLGLLVNVFQHLQSHLNLLVHAYTTYNPSLSNRYDRERIDFTHELVDFKILSKTFTDKNLKTVSSIASNALKLSKDLEIHSIGQDMYTKNAQKLLLYDFDLMNELIEPVWNKAHNIKKSY